MHNVELWTSTPCPYCEKVREFLKMLGVNYVEKRVLEHQKEAMEKGITLVPVTLVGKEKVIGGNKESLEDILFLLMRSVE